MSTEIFDNKKVTELMSRYIRHPQSRKLRDEIMLRALPLIDAAISRKRLFHLRDDLKQEASLKVLTALLKYNHHKGTAFDFLWTVICNVCVTHGERLSRQHLSISDDETMRESEAVSLYPAQFNPEQGHILNILAGLLKEAFNGNGWRYFRREQHKKASAYIQSAVASGELFSSPSKVYRHLRRMGFRKKQSQFFIEYTLVVLRTKLYEDRNLLQLLRSKQNIQRFATEPLD